MDFDIKALCADTLVAPAVSSISYQTYDRRNAYLPILDHYKAFLPLLEGELKARWGVVLTEPTADGID